MRRSAALSSGGRGERGRSIDRQQAPSERTHAPLRVDGRDGADVVLAREDEVGVEGPGGLHVQHRGRVDGHDLVVLHRQVLPRLLQVRHLKLKK